MLCLQTANNNGELASRVGEMIILYDPDKIEGFENMVGSETSWAK